MISVKALEFRLASIIRAGLRQAMRGADPQDIPTSLRRAEDRLTIVLYEPLYAQIQTTYAEGYVAGGNLIMRHAPRGTMLTAATPAPIEDPRIAKATKAVIYGLQDSLGNHKNEIQATMRAGFEKGESIPKLARRLDHYFDNNRAASTRMARTTTNDVYNRSHLDRYEDSGVVDGVQYSAHIDNRTSDICMMLNGTIWGIGNKDIQVPPSHPNCRSRLIPWFGKIPGKRDFRGEFGSEFVRKAEKTASVFRSKYWSPMPQTKASAHYQRSYFPKSDIKTITTGLNLAIKTERARRAVPDVVPLERLKTMIRYRKIDPDKSIIIDRFGKSLMLDKFDERNIIRSIKALIIQTESRIAREAMKRKKTIEAAWKEVLSTRKGIARMEKDILYYRKRMQSDPANTASYQKYIAQDKRLITTAKAQETRQIVEWNRYIDMKPSSTTTMLESEKERYQYMLDNFNFQDR